MLLSPVMMKKVVLPIASLLLCVLSCEPPFVEKGDHCVYLTEPRSFENGCDKKVHELFNATLYTQMESTVWLPVGRRYKYGPMVFTIPSATYSVKVESVINGSDYDYSNVDCMVTANDTLFPVDCSAKFPHLCAYYMRNSTTYSFEKGLSNCNHYAEPYEDCFCKLMDCNLNANVTHPYDFEAGLGISGEDICYDNFKSDNSCIVKNQDVPTPNLILNLGTTNALELKVYPFEGIFRFNDQSIFCYTDATENIESPVKVMHLINETFSNRSVFGRERTYEIQKEDYMGNYWCEAFLLSNLTLIKSNKILVWEQKEAEFVAMLTYENSNSYAACMKNPLDMLTNRVLVGLKVIFGQKVRLMEIVDAAEDTCRINFIVHTAPSVNKDSIVRFNQTQLEEAYSTHDVDGKIRFQYITNVDYCAAEYDGTLTWPGTVIGEEVQSLESCIDQNGIPVTRLCEGNFTYGARWQNKTGVACKVNSQDVPKAELILKFDVQRKELYLMVYSFEGLYNFKDPPIACFTDATEKFENAVVLNLIMATSDSKHVYRMELQDYIGNYWCEGFQLPDLDLIKSNKVLAYKQEASEFALMLTYENLKGLDSTCMEDPLQFLMNHVVYVLVGVFKSQAKATRLMEIIDAAQNNCRIDFVVHITKDQNDNSYFNQTEFETTYSRYDQNGTILLQYIANALYCEEENDGMLNWPKTKIGDTTTSLEICVDGNGIPVRRLCGGNFIRGALWLKTNYTCSDYKLPPQTQQLHNIALQNMDTNLANEAVKISSEAKNLIALDIEYFSKILNALRQNSSAYINNIVEIVDNLMESDADTLNQSQEYFNATDNILHISETLYADTELLKNETNLKIQKKNFVVQASKPFYNNIFGIALYGNNTSFTNNRIVTLNSSNALPDFNDDFILAVRLQNDSFYTTDDNLTIISTIYSHDKLFVDSQRVGGKIVSVVVPEFDALLTKPVTVWFRTNASLNGSCSFWDYGDEFQKKKGRWSNTGGNHVASFPNDSVVQCEYSHLTQFTFLVTKQAATLEIFNNNITSHYLYLNVITLTGTALSFFGVCVIFVTAAWYRQWRSEIGTKILLHLSFATLCEVILTQLADLNYVADTTVCTVFGILLHYFVSSKFCWMLVYAVLQYFKFVAVLKPRTNHLLLKAVVAGWFLPLLPVVILLVLIRPEGYSPGSFMFCYPKDLAFTMGVLMPIILIIIINALVFIIIMCKISKYNVKLQIIWAVVLFSVLGLPWWFGIFIEMFVGSWFGYVCVYMFCITATVQGFVLFIFYIVLNEEVSLKWKYVLCYRVHKYIVQPLVRKQRNKCEPIR